MKTSGTAIHRVARSLLMLLVCTFGCTISPRRVAVSQPGTPGTIVFTSLRALDGRDASNAATNIWLTNTDGSSARALTALTAAGASSLSPVWSPDGTKIAFESLRAPDGSNSAIPAVNVWVMHADGSSPIPLTRLTTQAASSTHPAWSPDGTRVAFDSTRALDGSNTLAPIANIWIVNADGSGATPVTTLTASLAASVSPAWSPDGAKIACISSRALNGTDAAIANRNIWVINPDGTGAQPLTRLTKAPSIDFAWSPDGRKIVFVSPRALDGSDALGTAANIWLMNADGSGATPLTRLTSLQNMTMATPVWSPDGGRIAFVSSRALDGSDTGGSVLNIWIMNADGSNTRALTKFVAATNVQPSWSSDGGKILFSSTRALDGNDAPNTNATSNIWLMNSDGTGAKPLTRNTASDADNTGPQTSPH